MQKLVWQNANGDEINLTGGNYGITEWEGFSNASLNIQNQQVPFQDGAVFLDALIEPRELSVTLKMQDKGNLEERYRMRRELIHSLNPKLGEGYLIYTNDFISKRIKCIPQIPLFETHNSDTRGTPKASLAWTACEPYWEDLEETVVFLNDGENIIQNDGDIPVGIKLDILNNSTQIKDILLRNANEDREIKLNVETNKSIEINTNVGNKKIESQNLVIDLIASPLGGGIAYSSKLKLYANVQEKTLKTSKNLVDWKMIDLHSNIYGRTINWLDETEEFIAIYDTSGIINFPHIYTSKDGIKWDLDVAQSLGSNNTFTSIAYGSGKYVLVGWNGVIYTSTDKINWTARTSGVNVNLNKIIYSREKNIFIIIGNSGTILTSQNGITWTSVENVTTSNINDIKEIEGKFILAGMNNTCMQSEDGVSWESVTIGSISGTVDFYGVTYILEKYYLYGRRLKEGSTYYSVIYNSVDLEWWTRIVDSDDNVIGTISSLEYVYDYGYYILNLTRKTLNFNSYETLLYGNSTKFAHSKKLKLYMYVDGFKIYTSYDFKNWLKYDSEYNIAGICYSEYYNCFLLYSNTNNNIRIFKTINGDNLQLIYQNTEWQGRIANLKVFDNVCFLLGGEYETLKALILKSENLSQWNNVSPITTGYFESVTKVNNKYIVVGGIAESSNSDGIVYESNNGENWIIKNLGSFTPQHLYSITSSPEGKIVIGGNSIYYSDDDINWQQILSSPYIIYDCVYSEYYKQFILTSYYYSIGTFYSITYFFRNGNKTMFMGEQAIENIYFNGIITTDNGDIFLFGSRYLYKLYYGEKENIINKISPGSNMNIQLEVGINNIVFSYIFTTETEYTSLIQNILKFRQKYLGV